MQAKEKYNNIVYKIEELVMNASYKKDYEISEEAFEAGMCYLDDRGKNTLFLFLMEKTVVDYINERRMMAAYNHIITKPKKDFRKAIELSGVQEQSSFIKKFNKMFGMTPTRAFENRDESRMLPVRDWDWISQEGKNIILELDKDENALRETKFGISKEMYIRAQRAENLQSFYKLNDLEAEFAFGLSDSCAVSLDEAFEYIYNYVWVYAEGKAVDNVNAATRDSRINEDLLNEDTLYLYFDCEFSFDDIYILLIIKHCVQIKQSLRELGAEYLRECLRYMKPVYTSWQLGIFNKKDFVKKYIAFEKAYPHSQKIMTQEEVADIYLEAFGGYDNFDEEMDGREVDPYEKDVFEEGAIYDDNYWDYEPDMDDPDWAQDAALSFGGEDFEEKELLCDDFDEEYFEKLCELEECKNETEEDKKPSKALCFRLDLNVQDME